MQMRDLDLTSLRYFVAVCETGGITRAAERENLVPSAISKRLAQLEEALGVQLLQRQRRGITPTPAGELLLEQSHAILANVQRVAQDVASLGSGVRGQVGLLATVSVIAENLPEDVAAFMQVPEHLNIHVQIEERLSRDILRSVREGSSPLGVLWDAGNLEGLGCLPYRADHLGVVVPSGHVLARRKNCSFAETLKFEHVGLQPAAAANALLLRAAALAGKQLNYRAQVSNFDAALRVVAAGLGVSVMPMEIALRTASISGLEVVPLKDNWARRRFSICYRDRTSMSKASSLLLDFLVAAARRESRRA